MIYASSTTLEWFKCSLLLKHVVFLFYEDSRSAFTINSAINGQQTILVFFVRSYICWFHKSAEWGLLYPCCTYNSVWKNCIWARWIPFPINSYGFIGLQHINRAYWVIDWFSFLLMCQKSMHVNHPANHCTLTHLICLLISFRYVSPLIPSDEQA